MATDEQIRDAIRAKLIRDQATQSQAAASSGQSGSSKWGQWHRVYADRLRNAIRRPGSAGSPPLPPPVPPPVVPPPVLPPGATPAPPGAAPSIKPRWSQYRGYFALYLAVAVIFGFIWRFAPSTPGRLPWAIWFSGFLVLVGVLLLRSAARKQRSYKIREAAAAAEIAAAPDEEAKAKIAQPSRGGLFWLSWLVGTLMIAVVMAPATASLTGPTRQVTVQTLNTNQVCGVGSASATAHLACRNLLNEVLSDFSKEAAKPGSIARVKLLYDASLLKEICDGIPDAPECVVSGTVGASASPSPTPSD